MPTEHDPVSFLGKRTDPAFEKRMIPIARGCSLPYDEADWHDALVVVERGEVELESESGDLRTFRAGDVLFLVGLQIRALHSRGREDAVLVAVSRRHSPTD